MKKILVYYSQLNIGGAEKSLIRIMNAFAADGNEVTYLGRYGHGKGEHLLDKRIKKEWLSSSPPISGGGLKSAISNAICILQRFLSLAKLLLQSHKVDIAFVGLQGLSPDLVLKYTRPKRVAIFIRTDISRSKDNGRVLNTLRRYSNKVDYYVCVAQTVKDAMIKMFPEVKEKVKVIYNILDVEEMHRNLQMAQDPFNGEKFGDFRILTVCRISDASKGVLRMVKVCRTLVDEGYQFRWYIVGDGPDMPLLKKGIRENGLEQFLLTPGRVNNPFGYYRECNLVAMLSYYEGLCGVVNEAKVAGKAIIATEVSGIREQLTHGINGWIVENDEEHILEGLRYLLTHKEVVQSLSNDIYPEEILDDKLKLQAFYKLINCKE